MFFLGGKKNGKKTHKIHHFAVLYDKHSARNREVAGSNPTAVSPILCPWERHFTRLSSLNSGLNEYLASASQRCPRSRFKVLASASGLGGALWPRQALGACSGMTHPP